MFFPNINKKMKQQNSTKSKSCSTKYPCSRHYVFTSYKLDLFESLTKERLSDLPVRYIAAQFEVTPTTGKDHIQGYVEFTKPQRYAGVKRILGDPKMNLGARGGTRDEARDYALKTTETLKQYPNWKKHGLRKEGTEPFEYGTWDSKMKSGRRSDLEAIWQLIRNGASEYML